MDDSPSRPRTAFVLAGGGTKGAFEVGALEHMVGRLGMLPDVVTSASAGSILSVVLSQARGAEEFATVLADLRADLLAMTDTEQVFGRQPWLDEFQGTPFGDAVNDFIVQRTRPPVPGGVPDPDAPDPTDATPTRHHRGFSHLVKLLDLLPAAGRARQRMDGHTSSMLTLDPLEAALRGTADIGFRPIDTTRSTRAGLDLRMAVTALQAGETHYVCNDGTIVGSDAMTPVVDDTGAPQRCADAIEGALASSTVPMLFPPRPFGNDIYVDGGVLQNIPVRAAVNLGAERIVAVAAVPLHPPRATVDFTRSNFIAVYLRCSSEIGFFDTQLTNLAEPLPVGAHLDLVAPTVDLVGPFEVQQGLMLLDMDYGAMRAEEALAELDEDARARAMHATDSLVVAREKAWYLEEACIADAVTTPERADVLAGLREQVGSAVESRESCGLPRPAAADAWVKGPEHHAAAVPTT